VKNEERKIISGNKPTFDSAGISLLTCQNGAPSHPAVWSFDQSLKSDNFLFTSLETLIMATVSTQGGEAARHSKELDGLGFENDVD
jgi:hypothetical protein